MKQKTQLHFVNFYVSIVL